MIAIIVISEAPCFWETIREQLRENDWKISCHTTFIEAQSSLASDIFDFCIFDGGNSLQHLTRGLSAAKSQARSCKFVAITNAPEEEVLLGYKQGFDYILPAPPQANMLRAVLLSQQPENTPPPMAPDPPRPPNDKRSPNISIIRDFTRLLSHSLDLPSLIHHFVLKVREMIGVNRIAIFLETHPPNPSSTRLQCVCSIGIPSDVQSCVELSTSSGIGSWVIHSGQILRAEQAGAVMSPAEFSRVKHEFSLLNCHIAIPINDRERSIGVAMIGGHLTRPGFTDDELQLIFHLMEELGLSVKNTWLHKELAANHKLFGDVLASMKNGSLVVGPDLEIVHANPAMLAFIRSDALNHRAITFADLPTPIAKRVHEVVEIGNTVAPFTFRKENGDHRIFRVSIIPFQNPSRHLPQSTMVIVEDFTEVENAKELAVEAANTRLTSLIAKRFAHEIRNSLVPLTTHMQLMDDRYTESDFQHSLKQALVTETTRIARFTEQMLFLAESRPPPSILTSVEKLLREAFAKAQASSRLTGVLTVQNQNNVSYIRCNPPALTQAFQEIFINGLQAIPTPSQVTARIEPVLENGKNFIRIGFTDNGPGFTKEAVKVACEPFFTSRNNGIGLGLTIASRAAHEHDGWLQIHHRSEGAKADVIMFFPSTDKSD